MTGNKYDAAMQCVQCCYLPGAERVTEEVIREERGLSVSAIFYFLQRNRPMKSKVPFLALVSAILLTGCGRSKPNAPLPAGGDRGTTKQISEWRTFSSPEGRFSVLMPGTPQTHKQNVQTPVGAITLHIFLVEHYTGNTGYAVSYGDYPKSLVEKGGPDSILDGAKAGSAANMKGSISREKKITLDQHPGREYLLSTPQGGYRARIYLVGERLYQNAVTGPANSSPDADKFLDSFKLVSE